MDPSQSTALQETLAQLESIQLPSEPSLWPPAFGYLICGLALFALGVLLGGLLKKRKGPRWFQTTHNLQSVIFKDWRIHTKAFHKGLCTQDEYLHLQTKILLRMNQLLKRIALTLDGRPATAQLTGQAWCEWLDQQADGQFFQEGLGAVLSDQIYGPVSAQTFIDVKAFEEGFHNWVKAIKNKTYNEAEMNEKPLSSEEYIQTPTTE